MQSGSKVVCVDDRFPVEILMYYSSLPLKDRVYTIRDMEVGVSINGEEGEIAVTLNELINPTSSVHPFRERGFKAERFRELEPPKETAESMTEELVGTPC